MMAANERKPSPAQMSALRSVQILSRGGGSYMPSLFRERTFTICERKGWLRRTSVDKGDKYNGYALTDTGRAILAAAVETSPRDGPTRNSIPQDPSGDPPT